MRRGPAAATMKNMTDVQEISGMRASDHDRQEVVDRLRGALDDGRLTLEEYLDRMAHAYQAVTHADLVPLCADLPAGGRGPRARAARHPGSGGVTRGRGAGPGGALVGGVRPPARAAQGAVDDLADLGVGQCRGLGPGQRDHGQPDLPLADVGGRALRRGAPGAVCWRCLLALPAAVSRDTSLAPVARGAGPMTPQVRVAWLS